MKSSIIVLSRCLRVSTQRALDKGDIYFHFHFRGVYKGIVLNEIIVIVDQEEEKYLLKEDYLLYLNVDKIIEGVLFGRPLKSKKLD